MIEVKTIFLGKETTKEFEDANAVLSYLSRSSNEKYDSFSNILQPVSLTKSCIGGMINTSVDFTLSSELKQVGETYEVEIRISKIEGLIRTPWGNKQFTYTDIKQNVKSPVEAFELICDSMYQNVTDKSLELFYYSRGTGNAVKGIMSGKVQVVKSYWYSVLFNAGTRVLNKVSSLINQFREVAGI